MWNVDRSARPDDGSPARLIAIMVGIVGILLLGSLAWSAVGALFSALGDDVFVLDEPSDADAADCAGRHPHAPDGEERHALDANARAARRRDAWRAWRGATGTA